MSYLKITNGQIEFPYFLSRLRKENQNTSFPKEIPDDVLQNYGVYPVKRVPPPEIDFLTQRYEEDIPTQINGVWTQVWKVVLVPGEMAAESVRANRKDLLAKSDWTQLQDAPVDKQAWAKYREELRAIPEQEGFPYSVQWPVAPDA
jgi:hypothetical protein